MSLSENLRQDKTLCDIGRKFQRLLPYLQHLPPDIMYENVWPVTVER